MCVCVCVCGGAVCAQQKKFGGFHSKQLTISLRIRIWSDIVSRFTKLFLLCGRGGVSSVHVCGAVYSV